LGLHAEAKYLAHLQAAWAVAAAVPIAAAVRALLRRLTPTTALRGIEGIAPFVVSLLLILPGDVGARTHSTNSADERSPRIRDLETVVRVLHDEQGWDVSHILEHLKTPYGVSLLSGVPLMPVSGGDTPSAAGSDGGSAMLVMFETSDLPEPMPSNWRIVSRSKRFTTVLILMQSRFDWHDFEVCLQPADGSETHCAASDMHADDAARIVVPNMPQPGSGWLGTLKLSFHLRASADPSGAEIFMPRIPMLCAGRIASPSDGALQVDPDGRHATVAVPPLGRDGVPPIAIEWRVGSPDCDVLSFDSLPPFFVEGEAATVRPVAATFRKAE